MLFHGKSHWVKEAGNKTGSADVYERLIERCNSEISKLILGNTLTTEASDTGTQALGTVHKKGEDAIIQADRNYLLDVLNYNLTDILADLGFDTGTGRFYFPERKALDDTTRANILVQLKNSFNLPVADDFLYETFGIDKPQDYDSMKERIIQEGERQRLLLERQLQQPEPSEDPQTDGNTGDSFKNRLRAFFGIAPHDGAASDW